MKSQCPCGAVYTIKPEFLGKRTVCKNCGQSFLIEALPLAPPLPSPAEHLEIPLPGSPVTVEPLAAPSESWSSEPGLSEPGPAEHLEIPQFAPGREEPAELEEIEPLVIYPVDSLEEPKLPAFEVEDEGGRRSILALLVAAVAGVLVGAGLMGLFRQSEVDALAARLATASRELQVHSQARQKLGALKKELDSVQDEIRLLERNDYPAGSIPQTLAAAAVLEYKTAEALLRQQIAALEGGARLAVVARATPPDPKLAEAVEGEMARLHARVETLRAEAQGLDEVPRSVVQTAVATEELNMAILNRNRLIARYGLSAPLPARGGTD